MKFGVHLPLMDFGSGPPSLAHLADYVRTAAELEFGAISANDHLVFSTPWLDGPTALAAVLAHAGEMTLATTCALPVVRGPVPVAKALAAIDRLSGGRLIAAVAPGSSPDDYRVAGIEFEERWSRFDESVQALRALWRPAGPGFAGRYYDTTGIALDPPPMQAGGPPIWIGSWGSRAGLRRAIRLGDGWLASAYNTTPDDFGHAWLTVQELLCDAGRPAAPFPNGLATMWFFISEDGSEAERMLTERLAPVVHRPAEILRERLPVGSAEMFAARLDAFQKAGVQRVFLWPIADEIRQLELFAERVRPAIPG